LETADSIPFAGKQITFSFYARAGANFSQASNALGVIVVTGTGTDQNLQFGYTGQTAVINTSATLTTTWQRFTFTTAAALSNSTTQLGFYFPWIPTGTAGAADFFEITGIMINVGTTALPYRRNAGTIQGELSAAQRYYETFAMSAQRNTMAAQSTSSAFGAMFYKVTKRGTPTVTLPASGSGSGQIAVLNSSGSYPSTIGTVAADQITVDSCCIKVTGATSAYTAGQALVLYTNGAATIAVEAEL
jgi:hypothetical protein